MNRQGPALVSGALEDTRHPAPNMALSEGFLKVTEETRTGRAMYPLPELSSHSRAHESKLRTLQVSVASRVQARQRGFGTTGPLFPTPVRTFLRCTLPDKQRHSELGWWYVVWRHKGLAGCPPTQQNTCTAHLRLRARC